MTTTKKLPLAACLVRDFVKLEIAPAPAADASAEAKAKPRTFSMVANTGKILSHPYYGNLGIDLAGIQFRQQLPALLDHDPGLRVGYTTKVELTDAGLVASGAMLSNQHAQVVLSDSADGFPWQASVRLEPGRVEVLEPGQTAKVNGQTITGPAHIMRESTLREVTFTTLGADDQTTAAALSDSTESVAAVFFSKDTQAMEMDEVTAAVLKLSAVQLSAMHPEAAKQLRQEGAELERARVAAILGAADSEQTELAQQMVAEGLELNAALTKLGADLREKVKAIRLAAAATTGKQATTPMGGGNGDGGEGDGTAPNAADVELRASFPEGPKGDRLFSAYKRNEHRTRTFKATKDGDE